MPDHVVGSTGDRYALLKKGVQREEPAHVLLAEDSLQCRSIQIKPARLHVHADIEPLDALDRLLIHHAAVHHVVPFAADRFLFVETFECVEQSIDRAAALRVRRELPALRASRMENPVQLVGIDEKRPPASGSVCP